MLCNCIENVYVCIKCTNNIHNISMCLNNSGEFSPKYELKNTK